MEGVLDELDGEEGRPSRSLKQASGERLAARLKEAAKDLDFLLGLAVDLVDSCNEGSEFIPAHECDRD